jgi:hypothetical protein
MFNYIRSNTDGVQFITVFINGTPHVASTETHSNFSEIVETIESGFAEIEEKVMNLISSKGKVDAFLNTVNRYSDQKLNLRLEDGVLSDKDGNLQDELVESLKLSPTAAAHFYRKFSAITRPNVKARLKNFLAKHAFHITEEGNILAYKGVKSNFYSVNTGDAFCNGIRCSNESIPNLPGDKLMMTPSMVDLSDSACGAGLHAGSYEYAKDWSKGKIVLVEIDPRDIITVPTDCDMQKLRTFGYKVIKEVSKKEEYLVAKTVNSGFDDIVLEKSLGYSRKGVVFKNKNHLASLTSQDYANKVYSWLDRFNFEPIYRYQLVEKFLQERK